MTDDEVLDAVGPRLRAARAEQGATLAQVAAATGISVSTLSRLESGGRRPTLELLLPLARVYEVALDELVGGAAQGRTSDDDITCFLNYHGVGLQFAAIGALLYRKALAAGAGRDLPTDWFTQKEIP